jgi:hypothetical protein
MELKIPLETPDPEDEYTDEERQETGQSDLKMPLPEFTP